MGSIVYLLMCILVCKKFIIDVWSFLEIMILRVLWLIEIIMSFCFRLVMLLLVIVIWKLFCFFVVVFNIEFMNIYEILKIYLIKLLFVV